MKTRFQTRARAVVLATLAAAAMASASSAAFAQMDGGMMRHLGMNHDPAKMAQVHERHLAELKAKLQLTAQQEAAWNSFADSMKLPAVAMDKKPEDKKSEWAALQQLPTPERIDRMRALRKEHMAAMETAMDKRAEATKVFYAALTPTQQKVFDAQHMQMIQMMHNRKGGMRDGNKPSDMPWQ
ncbi:MAG: Spy/CpxP family protein refolding chaperone [Rhodoferax sp.]|nr:Spy/CpxP family protein refolding chaperone [Rhodoferax sp.]